MTVLFIAPFFYFFHKKISAWAEELERNNNDFSLLIQFGDLLQGCKDIGEAYVVIQRSAANIFPASEGALHVFNDSGTLVTACSWGRDAPCGAGPDDGIPIIAQGERLGILQVALPSGKGLPEEKQRLAVSMAEHIGMSLQNLRLSERLREMTIRDPLTGLYNRRHMDASLEREVCRASRKGASLSMIMLDIDHFKTYNDTFGHEAGDSLLKALGGLLAKSVRSSDIACRYGGEEFLLILPDASLEAAGKRAEQVREAIKAIGVTASFGVSAFPVSGNTAGEVIGAADSALYEAKRAGRDRVCVTGKKPSNFDQI